MSAPGQGGPGGPEDHAGDERTVIPGQDEEHAQDEDRTQVAHVIPIQAGGGGGDLFSRYQDLQDLWGHAQRTDHEVADALVIIAEHVSGGTTTGPLCPAIARVLVFVARNVGKREAQP